MASMGTPCNCPEHRDQAVTKIGAHEFTLESDYLKRWACSCGDYGGMEGRSDEWMYHAWLRHVDRAERNLT